MAKRLTPEERERRAAEKAAKKREREQAREAKRRAKEEEKARKKREKEEKRRLKEIERGKKMKRRPRWLYWLIREQEAKEREHRLYLEAGRVAIALGRAIRKIQQKIMELIGQIINRVAEIKTPEARLIWSQEPWTPQDRNRYNWGKRQELKELIEQNPDGVAEQDPEQAAQDARRKTRARQIDRAKAMDKVLDGLIAELREDEENAVRSSLERSYSQVYEDVLKELDDKRRAIDADKEDESRIADGRDYTANGNPRRTTPETQIPENMPRLGGYGDTVVFGAPSPDQVKTVLNTEFNGKDFSERIWNDTDKLAAELKDMIQAAIINGENSRIVAQRLAQKMGVEFTHAERLVRTEMNRILNQATLDGMKDAGAEKYEFVAIIDDRTCIKCQRKNGKIFKISEKKTGLNFPPIHPYCRCTIIARFDWEDEDLDEPDPDVNGAIQKTIDGWLKEAEAINKDKVQAVRDNPTEANVQAVVDEQDADRKAKEQSQKVVIGIQRRAIQQGKLGKEEVTKKKIKKTEADRAFKKSNERKQRKINAIVYTDKSNNSDVIKQIHDNIEVGDVSPMLVAAVAEYESRDEIEAKTKLMDSVLEELTSAKSKWNGQIGEITEEMQEEYEDQLLIGAYLPEKNAIAFRGTPTLSTMIHELMHARSKIDEDEFKKLNEHQIIIEENIEEGLCEFISMCIFKKMGKEAPEDISYEPFITKIYQIYKRVGTDALEFAIDLFKTPKGLRFKKIKTMLENIKDSTLTKKEIKGIIQNAEEVFLIPFGEL